MDKKSKIFITLISLLIVAIATLITIWKGSLSRDLTNAQTITWDLLYQYDYKTKNVPSAIKKIDGKIVRLPGFIVPLSHNYSKLDEFLLVPDPQSCIHIPPPPPNLIVLVKLEAAVSAQSIPYPAWIIGEFEVVSSQSQYGDAAYKMIGKKIEPYEW